MRHAPGGLVQSGLTTRLAKVVLDVELSCADGTPPPCSRELGEMLTAELAALDERLACLTRSRDSVARFLALARNDDLMAAAPPA